MRFGATLIDKVNNYRHSKYVLTLRIHLRTALWESGTKV